MTSNWGIKRSLWITWYTNVQNRLVMSVMCYYMFSSACTERIWDKFEVNRHCLQSRLARPTLLSLNRTRTQASPLLAAHGSKWQCHSRLVVLTLEVCNEKDGTNSKSRPTSRTGDQAQPLTGLASSNFETMKNPTRQVQGQGSRSAFPAAAQEHVAGTSTLRELEFFQEDIA